jgi:anthranilate phosphoribosyltransferase
MSEAVMNRALRSSATRTPEGARTFLEACLDPASDPREVGAALLRLNERPYTAGLLTAFARVLRERAVPLDLPVPAVDTCGTGGDARGGVRTANLSTLSALLLARMGVDVAKHGSRSASSLCGSADLLEALGLDLAREPGEIREDLARTHFAFLFAPRFHPALAQVAPIRKALGVPTVFNMLGPLLNPARPPFQVLGVAREAWILPVAEALASLGLERALVVHGLTADGLGLDEASLDGPTRLRPVVGGRVLGEEVVHPGDLGLRRLPRPPADSREACVALARALAAGAHDPAYPPGVAEDVALQAALALALVRDRPLGELGALAAEARAALEEGLHLPTLLSLAA